jgi:HEAT repeat protein
VFTLQTLEWAIQLVGIALVLSFMALIGMRWRMDFRAREVAEAIRALERPLHAWLVCGADVTAVRDALRGMRAPAAFRSLARLATQQLTLQHQQTLARVLRGEPWASLILRHARSRLWWRRFDAARLLCVVGDARDAELIATLMDDPNPAVRLVAIDAAARLPGRALIDRELDSLPRRQDAVQAYQIAALSYHPLAAGDALMRRLTLDAPERKLIPWINAAGALAIPAILDRVLPLASHASFEVRLHVAMAMRRHASPDTPPTLLRLLADDDWRVRAQSARALGALRCRAAIDELAHAVRDRSWWVRFRSALALAQIGGEARQTLHDLRTCDDRMARDMSTLVAGLSSAAVVEMAET